MSTNHTEQVVDYLQPGDRIRLTDFLGRWYATVTVARVTSDIDHILVRDTTGNVHRFLTGTRVTVAS